MHLATPIRRSLLHSGLPRGAENSNRYAAASFLKINRNIALIESPVSHSKQRIAPQINRKLSRDPSPRSNGFSSYSPLACPPCPDARRERMRRVTRHWLFNRHTVLLEFAVSYRKQSNLKILIETKTGVFPQPASGCGGRDLSFQNGGGAAMMLAKGARPKSCFCGCASLRSRVG
jgi:hypothetical protein